MVFINLVKDFIFSYQLMTVYLLNKEVWQIISINAYVNHPKMCYFAFHYNFIVNFVSIVTAK